MRFKPHQRHWVVSLSKNINPNLVLVYPWKTRPFITERLLMGLIENACRIYQHAKGKYTPFLHFTHFSDFVHITHFSDFVSVLLHRWIKDFSNIHIGQFVKAFEKSYTSCQNM